MFKKCVVIWKDQREFLCAKISGNCIVNENAFNFVFMFGAFHFKCFYFNSSVYPIHLIQQR